MIVDHLPLEHLAVLLAMEQFITLRAQKLTLLTALVLKYVLSNYLVKFYYNIQNCNLHFIFNIYTDCSSSRSDQSERSSSLVHSRQKSLSILRAKDSLS